MKLFGVELKFNGLDIWHKGNLKIGANLSITEDGTLNANDNPASFIRKQERFTVDTGQTVFNLTKGTYKPNTSAMTWFINGDKQDDRALSETSSTSVTLPAGLPAGAEILFEWLEVINIHPYPEHAAEHLPGGVDDLGLKQVALSGSYNDLTDRPNPVVKGEKVNLPASTTTEASLNIPHGTAPTSPVNGDLWTTTAGPYMRVNGATRTIYHSGNAGTAALSTVTQVEAEAGTATTVRGWTAQRIAQAIAKLQAVKSVNGSTGEVTITVPTKLSELTNDIGAGGGVKITTSATAPTDTSPGDFWYKEV